MSSKEIAKLPTLMDSLNQFWAREYNIEKWTEKDIFGSLIPKRANKGKFEPILMEDGTHILMPLSPLQYTFYRGESKYHEKCYPSLYREDMTESKIFLERLKRCELELMLQEYPVTNLFANSIYTQSPDGQEQQIRFRVGYDGLAQHYGIKTEFLDISVDPLVAAFFAATTYDSKTDSYSPITDTTKNAYGVFYIRTELPMIDGSHQRVDVVGMQPLYRPGRQAAFVYRLDKGENFNERARKFLFRHDAKVNRLIFELANVNNRLFPKELLNDKIRNGITNNKVFSPTAYKMAKEKYYFALTDDELQEYLKEERICIRKDNMQWFTEKEKQEATEYWGEYQKELLSNIQIRWAYEGPVNVVDKLP